MYPEVGELDQLSWTYCCLMDENVTQYGPDRNQCSLTTINLFLLSQEWLKSADRRYLKVGLD